MDWMQMQLAENMTKSSARAGWSMVIHLKHTDTVDMALKAGRQAVAL